MEDLGIDERVILKWKLKKQNGRAGMDWISLAEGRDTLMDWISLAEGRDTLMDWISLAEGRDTLMKLLVP